MVTFGLSQVAIRAGAILCIIMAWKLYPKMVSSPSTLVIVNSNVKEESEI